MNYSYLPYLMLQAIRELKAENDSLRGQVEQIRAATVREREQRTEIRQLRADVERLKASEKVKPAALAAVQ